MHYFGFMIYDSQTNLIGSHNERIELNECLFLSFQWLGECCELKRVLSCVLGVGKGVPP